MRSAVLLTGTRIEIEEIVRDPRIREAEEALSRFDRSGSTRDAAVYARACIALVREVVPRIFPAERRAQALVGAGVKVLDAYTAIFAGDQPGWLAWALAHELRDLAIAHGIDVEPLRAPRPPRGSTPDRASLSPDRVLTLYSEIHRLLGPGDAVSEIQTILGLNTTEVGRLFGVTRQAVDQWQGNGIPAERVADVERIRDVAQVLFEELIPERIPRVVRTPAKGLDGRTILEVLADPGGSDRVRGYLARLYSFLSA
jgi:hypothetical protein